AVLATCLLAVAPAPAGVAAGTVDVRLRPLGPTAVPQGAPFTVRATLSNSDPGPADVSLSLELIDVAGGGESVGAFKWEATVPGQGSVSNRAPLVSAQWFTDQGTFEVRALINGQQAGNVLDYEVAAPMVDVPTFVDVTGQSGVDATLGGSTCGAWAAGAAWGDIDGDGDPDLYLPRGTEPSQLWINDGTGLFTDQTSLLPAGSTFGAGYQAAWFDYDGDGDQDLYLANDRWGPSPDRNHLWRNDGGSFTDVSIQSYAGYFINSMGIGIGDVDGDL